MLTEGVEGRDARRGTCETLTPDPLFLGILCLCHTTRQRRFYIDRSVELRHLNRNCQGTRPPDSRACFFVRGFYNVFNPHALSVDK